MAVHIIKKPAVGNRRQRRKAETWVPELERMSHDVKRAVLKMAASLDEPAAQADPANVPASPSDVGQLLRRTAEYMKLLRRISEAALQGDDKRLRSLIVKSLTSCNAKIAALVRVHARNNARRTLNALRQESDEIDLTQPCLEPVRVWWKKKPNGGHRPIGESGPIRFAMQLMLRDVLVAAGEDNPHEFACRRRGPHKAADFIAANIRSGVRYWATLDITNCFPSVKPEHLKDMFPIDHAMLVHAAFIPEGAPLTPLPGATGGGSSATAVRHGLPQGSPVSPKLASGLIGRLLRSLEGDYRVICYGDNIALGAEAQGEVETGVHTLGERLALLDAGPLALGKIELFEADSYVDFMQFRIGAMWSEGEFVDDTYRRPSGEAFERRRRRMCERLRRFPDDTPREVIEKALADYDFAWMRSMKWPNLQLGPSHAANILDLLAAQRDALIREIFDYGLPDEIAGKL